jgi:hypothetical protein
MACLTCAIVLGLNVCVTLNAAREMSELFPPSASRQRALYVYYRVPQGQVDEAHARVRALQASLSVEWPGLRARLLCRADDPSKLAEPTWMETYEHADGVSAACEARLAKLVAELPPGLIGARHTEVFCELPQAAT